LELVIYLRERLELFVLMEMLDELLWGGRTAEKLLAEFLQAFK
jgi:hypothetical protein